jgi:hypothetical protein
MNKVVFLNLDLFVQSHQKRSERYEKPLVGVTASCKEKLQRYHAFTFRAHRDSQSVDRTEVADSSKCSVIEACDPENPQSS